MNVHARFQVLLSFQIKINRASEHLLPLQDFEGGHIRGCLNIPADDFDSDEQIDAIIDSHCANKDLIILHCMLSQQRGPFCALRYGKSPPMFPCDKHE